MYNRVYFETGVLFLLAFLLTALFCRALVPVLRRKKASQPILTIGPAWHLSKSGTPTMGGLGFIAAVLAAFTVYAVYLKIGGRRGELFPPLLALWFALGCGAIGFFDDRRKLLHRQNEGLTPPQKYLLQLLVSGAFLAAARVWGGVSTAVRLPFSGIVIDLGFWFYPLALLFLTGVVNAFNLTDGLDGLLSSVTAVVAAFFVAWGVFDGKNTATVGALLLGATLGFLLFNAHPAKVFMGDTGSLFLGGAVAALGILTADPLTVLTASGVCVLETASVILQVLYFKLTHGKRLFLMAPFHHHLEKRGWSERRVVAVFAAVTALFAALAFRGGRS